MDQATKPAPFNVGDHVRFIAEETRELGTGEGRDMNLVLTPGMEGVIVLSTGDLSDHGEAAAKPWHCRVQFQNGFQLDITPENEADFVLTRALS